MKSLIKSLMFVAIVAMMSMVGGCGNSTEVGDDSIDTSDVMMNRPIKKIQFTSHYGTNPTPRTAFTTIPDFEYPPFIWDSTGTMIYSCDTKLIDIGYFVKYDDSTSWTFIYKITNNNIQKTDSVNSIHFDLTDIEFL